MNVDVSEEFAKRVQGACAALVKQHAIACEQLTGDQIASALEQALRSGDFQMYVANTGGKTAQSVVYLPFYGMDRLRNRIKHLEEILKEHGIEEPKYEM